LEEDGVFTGAVCCHKLHYARVNLSITTEEVFFFTTLLNLVRLWF
jgi:hypothetical protein